MIVARATRGYAAAACRSCVLSAIVVVVAVTTIVEIRGGGWYQLVAVDKSRIVCRVWPNRVECCRLLARDSGVMVRRRLFSQDERRRRWGFDGAGGLDVVWRAILVVFVVGVGGGGGRLIDEMSFWWWASANYWEASTAVAVATKRTRRRRTVFPTCFFFVRGFRPINAGAESSFPSQRISKWGRRRRRSRFLIFFFILLVAVIM